MKKGNVKGNSKPENFPPPPLLVKLIHLIGALTRGQKRDFKKTAGFWGGEGGQKYIWLYDFINAWLTDDKDIQQLMPAILKTGKLNGKAEFSQVAAYLYDKILESMRGVPDSTPHMARLMAMIQDAYFLFNKGLFDDCMEMIEKAKQLALDLDKPALSLELMYLERRAILQGNRRESERIYEIYEEEQTALEKLRKVTYYNHLSHQVALAQSERLPVTDALREELIQVQLEEKEGVELLNLSSRAAIRYFNLLTNYFNVQFHFEKGIDSNLANYSTLAIAWDWRRRMLEVYEQKPMLIEEEPLVYWAHVDSWVAAGIRLRKFSEMETFIKNIETNKDELIRLRSASFNRLLFYIAQNRFADACDYIEKNELEQRLEDMKLQIPESRLMSIWISCAQVYFLRDQLDIAENWLKKLVDAPKSGVRPDLRTQAKLMEIICLFEAGVYEWSIDPVAPVSNLYRAISKSDIMDNFMRDLLQTVKIVLESPNPQKDKNLGDMIQKCIQGRRRATTAQPYACVLAWLEAKYNGTTIEKEIEKYTNEEIAGLK